MKMYSESLDELVFENRNKAYGAYVIRKEYAGSLKIGMLVSYGFIGLIVLCSGFMNKGKMIIEDLVPPLFDTTEMLITPPPISDPPPVAEKPVGGPKVNSFVPVVDDKIIEKPVVDELPTEVPPSNTEGPGETTTELPGTGPQLVETPSVNVQPSEVLVADEMPEMEGGVMKFLRKNLSYPSLAVENKTKGTVFISFVVEKDGSVTDISVLKGIGDGCEEEATRVVKKMKWRPGKNHGHPVRVRFNLPVKFTINE